MNMPNKFLTAAVVLAVWLIWMLPPRGRYQSQENSASSLEARKKADYARIEQEMSKNPLFLTLKKYDTNYYGRFRGTLEAAANGNISIQEVISRLYRMDDFGSEHLSHATDEAVLAFAQTQIAVLQQVLAKNTDLCFAILWGDAERMSKKDGNLRLYLTPASWEAMFATKALVVETSMTKPQPAPEEASVQTKIEQLWNELAKLHPDDVQLLSDVKAAQKDKRKACALLIELLENAVKLPQKDASAVLRTMLAAK